MDEEIVQLIVQAIAEGFDDVQAAMQGTEDATEGAGQQFESAGLKLTEFRSGLGLAREALGALNGAYQQTIGTAVSWGQTVTQVAEVSGTSAESASRMAVVLGDFGMQADSMNMAVKTLTKEGLQFNLDTLIKLAGQYQQIQDPVSRDQFLFTNFGRSGADLATMLSQPVEKLQAMAEQADSTGKVLSGESAQALLDYGLKAKQAGDQIDGLKIQIGELAVDVNNTTGALQGISDRVETLNLLNQAMKDHALTTGEAANVIFQWMTNITSGGATVDYLKAKIDAATASTNYQDAATRQANEATAEADANAKKTSDDLAAQAQHIQDVTAYWEKYTQTVQNADLAAQAQHVQDVTNYWQHYSDVVQEAKDSLEQAALAAGLAGKLQSATDSYRQSLVTTNPELAKLQAQLAHYEALQGETITVTQAGTVTQEQYQTAVDRLSIAQERLNEYHGKSKASLDSLRLSVEQAQQKVDELGTKMGSGQTATANYASTISDLKQKIGDLNDKNDAAAAAIQKTTSQMVYQTAVAALPNIAAQDALAHKLGLISDADYTLISATQAVTAQYDLNHDGTIEANEATDAYYSSLVSTATASANLAQSQSELQPTLGDTAQGFDRISGSAHGAQQDIQGVVDTENSLHDTTITITTRYINQTYGSQGPGYEPPDPNAPKGASGLDMIVPAGYPNDTFPVYAQSGERVIVQTPAQQRAGAGMGSGGGGGDTIIVNDRKAMALYLERRRHKTLAGLEASMS